MKKVKPCKSKHILFSVDKCSGCAGHKGHHWSYSAEGSLIQWRNDSDPKSKKGSRLMQKYGGFGSSNTPPDHASYIHPKAKMKYAYRWLQFRHLKLKRKKS